MTSEALRREPGDRRASGVADWSPLKRFAAFQLIAWALLSVVIVLPALGLPSDRASRAAAWILAWAATGMAVSTGLAAIFVHLPDRWLRGYRLAPTLLLTSVTGASVWGACVWIAELVTGPEPWIPPDAPPAIHVVVVVVRGSFSLGLWSALFLVMLFSERVQQAREQSARAEALASEARLQLLRSQLDPHFLFNALNSVIALIQESPRGAQSMVRDLAALLRRSLDADGSRPTTVADEIDFVRLYLRCEQVRFEDRLRVTFDVPDDVNALPVPPMLVHPLVENAIKHGMRGALHAPLEVHVSAEQKGEVLALEVSNTGTLAAGQDAVLPRGPGIGLRSVRERLVHLFGDRGVFSLAEVDGRVVARIELPVRTREVKA